MDMVRVVQMMKYIVTILLILLAVGACGQGSGPASPHSGYHKTKMKLFNVRDFGAKGDSTTDDAAAFQAAAAAADAVNGVVYGPAGQYNIESLEGTHLVLPNFLGAGPLTRLYLDADQGIVRIDSGGWADNFAIWPTDTTGMDTSTIAPQLWSGKVSGQSHGAYISRVYGRLHIYMQNSHNFTVRDCDYIVASGGNSGGLVIDGGGSNWLVDNMKLRDGPRNEISLANIGINGKILNSTLTGGRHSGIWLDDPNTIPTTGLNLLVDNCVITGHFHNGIDIVPTTYDDSLGFTISNCEIAFNTQPGIYVDGAGMTIINNKIHDNQQDGIRFKWNTDSDSSMVSTGNTINGNKFKNNALTNDGNDHQIDLGQVAKTEVKYNFFQISAHDSIGGIEEMIRIYDSYNTTIAYNDFQRDSVVGGLDASTDIDEIKGQDVRRILADTVPSDSIRCFLNVGRFFYTDDTLRFSNPVKYPNQSSPSGLSFFTEADDNDTSVFTATAPNTTVGFNDQLTMQGNDITGVNEVAADTATVSYATVDTVEASDNENLYLLAHTTNDSVNVEVGAGGAFTIGHGTTEEWAVKSDGELTSVVGNGDHFYADTIKAGFGIYGGSTAALAPFPLGLTADSADIDKYTDGSIDTPDLADAAVSAAKLGPDAVSSSRILDSSIFAQDLAITNSLVGADNYLLSLNEADSGFTLVVAGAASTGNFTFDTDTLKGDDGTQVIFDIQKITTDSLDVSGTASGTITLTGATSGSAAISVPDIAGTPAEIHLPSATGTAGYSLITNGATPQVTSWDGTTLIHVTSDGSDHSFIDQDVTIASSPTLDGTNITGIITGAVEQTRLSARKASAGTITTGMPVYITGYNVGGWILVEAADASSGTTMPAIGIALGSITNAATGVVVTGGELTAQVTDTNTVKDPVYVANGGGWTTTKPTGTNLIQKVGTVNRSHATLGIIQVVGAGRTNDVPNIPSAQFWLGNGSAVATAVTMSGEATMDNAGVVTVSSSTFADSAGTSSEWSQLDSATIVNLTQQTTPDTMLYIRSLVGSGTVQLLPKSGNLLEIAMDAAAAHYVDFDANDAGFWADMNYYDFVADDATNGNAGFHVQTDSVVKFRGSGANESVTFADETSGGFRMYGGSDGFSISAIDSMRFDASGTINLNADVIDDFTGQGMALSSGDLGVTDDIANHTLDSAEVMQIFRDSVPIPFTKTIMFTDVVNDSTDFVPFWDIDSSYARAGIHFLTLTFTTSASGDDTVSVQYRLTPLGTPVLIEKMFTASSQRLRIVTAAIDSAGTPDSPAEITTLGLDISECNSVLDWITISGTYLIKD